MATIALPKIAANTYIKRPGGGIEGWHNESEAVFENDPLDSYYRFVWTRLEGATEGSYNWAYFDDLVEDAKARKQKLSFGIMTAYPEGTTSHGLASYDGGFGAYPLYVHQKMQQETVKDWRKGTSWTPNYNSAYYLTRYAALCAALNQHIYDKGYENYVLFIDIRGYGSWGEWNSSGLVNNTSEYPAGTFPTVTSLKKIVDAHTLGFPKFPLVAMIAGFDANWLGNVNNPPEIAYYLLTTKNQWGLLGWRRDQWGQTDQYLKDYLENNNRSFNGVIFKNLIMDRYRFAPITGEPAPSGNTMTDLVRQINLYHATSFGDGNYGSVGDVNLLRQNVAAAATAAGYKLQIVSGTFTNTNSSVNITINWANLGLASVYEDWTVKYQLKNSGGAVVAEKESSFKPKLFLGTFSVTDTFLISLAAGTYQLSVIIQAPGRDPMPLYNGSRAADGSYPLGSVVTTGSQPLPNQPPVVSAGADQTITLPVSSVSLTGSATDKDGSIAKVLWERVSGSGIIDSPNTTGTQITGLTAGTSVFKLTATDNAGASVSDTVAVIVNPADPADIKKLIDIVETVETTYTAVYSDGSKETIVK